VQSGPQSSGDIHLNQEVWHYVTSFDTAVATIQNQITNGQIRTPDGVSQNPCTSPGNTSGPNAPYHRVDVGFGYYWMLSTGGESVAITVYNPNAPKTSTSSTVPDTIVPAGAEIDIVYEIGTCDS
jgi:hypothetical protein